MIRAAVLRGAQGHEADFVGFVDGWRGVLDAQTIELGWRAVRGAAAAPGTVLGASPHDDAVGSPDLDAVVAGVRMSNLDGLLMVGVVLLAVLFKTSSSLASAYGIAVTGTMLLTASLTFLVMWRMWKWSPVAAAAVMLPFIVLEFLFLLHH